MDSKATAETSHDTFFGLTMPFIYMLW